MGVPNFRPFSYGLVCVKIDCVELSLESKLGSDREQMMTGNAIYMHHQSELTTELKYIYTFKSLLSFKVT